MRILMRSLLLISLIVSGAGLAWTQEAQGPTVSAALSLKGAFEEIALLYETRHPGERVVFNFAASGVLQRQIESGAPVDVFASASSREMDELERKQLIVPGSRRTFARNEIVLIVPAASALSLRSFSDLAAGSVRRIAVGNPATVPAGKYAEEVLRSSAVLDSVGGRLVLCEHVRQVLDYTVRGEVDAGILFATDAAGVREAVVVASATPGSHSPAMYHVAVLKDPKRGSAGRAFIDLLLSPEGQMVLKRRGFRSVQ